MNLTLFQRINMHNGDTSVCWEWTGKLNKKDGRPYVRHEGKLRPAYSVVLELVTGEAPEGRLARHSCDNGICCNPHHLSWGSNQDNSNDMMERDRHGFPKTIVRYINRLLADGIPHSVIAKRYGCKRETITAIANERSHTHAKTSNDNGSEEGSEEGVES